MLANEPAKGTLSVGEVQAAIEALGDADWLRLRKAAAIYANRCNPRLDSDELLDEAFSRTLLNDRKCPEGLSMVVFLGGVMKSIVSKGELRRNKKDALSHIDSSHCLTDDEMSFAIPTACSPAEELIAIETFEQALTLFENDEEASMVIMSKQDNMAPHEIQELMGINQTQYNTILRRISRKYSKLIQGGDQS